MPDAPEQADPMAGYAAADRPETPSPAHHAPQQPLPHLSSGAPALTPAELADRTAPMDGDCTAGKHRPCAGNAWDDATDTLTACSCLCHVTA